jgi:intein/homing endonuclease
MVKFKKGQIPWNKREPITLICKQCKKKFIVPYRKRNQKYCSVDCKKQSMIGKTPWNKGISPSEEQRKKQSEFMKEYYKTHSSPMKGKKQSKETIEKCRISQLKRVERNNVKSEEIDLDWAKLIGYLLSDGYWGKGQTLKFVNNNLSYIEEVKDLAKKKGFFIAERDKNDGVEIHLKVFEKVGQNFGNSKILEAVWRAYFRSWGIYDRDSLGIILNLPKQIQISFLKGYFNGDGYLWIGKDRSKENRITRIEIGFCIGIHKTLAEDIQKMLSKWGINSAIKSEWMEKSTRPFYRVIISKRESGKKLIHLLEDSKYPKKFERAKSLMKTERRS